MNQVPWKETKNGVPYPSLKRHPSHWRKKAECRKVGGFRKHKYILYFPAKPLRKWQIETGSPASGLRNDCCNPSLEPKQQKSTEPEPARTIDACQ